MKELLLCCAALLLLVGLTLPMEVNSCENAAALAIPDITVEIVSTSLEHDTPQTGDDTITIEFTVDVDESQSSIAAEWVTIYLKIKDDSTGHWETLSTDTYTNAPMGNWPSEWANDDGSPKTFTWEIVVGPAEVFPHQDDYDIWVFGLVQYSFWNATDAAFKYGVGH